MTCKQAAQLLPALALDALDGPERELVEAHLRRCPDCAREQQALQEIVTQLALAVPQVDPPAALREQIVASATDDGRRTTDVIPVLRPSSVVRRPSRLRWSPAFSLAALVLALAALVWGASLQNELGTTRAQAADSSAQLERIRGSYGTIVRVLGSPQMQVRDLQPSEAAPTAQGRLWLDSTSGQGMLMAHDLPPLAVNQSYQVWLVNAQGRVNAGLLRESDDSIYYLLIQPPGKLTDYQRLGVTREPAGGSPGPTGPRIIGGDL